jgi:uncharacterized protein (TIGR03435 family)
MPNDDMALLREYAARNSEDAFAALVSRHVNLVYSVALRQVGDAHLAEEITQAVFVILARKANSLGEKTILSGWLCRTARFASADAVKMQRRRQMREQEAYMQSTLTESESNAWTQIAPMLDAALAKLNRKDHDAVVLRFFENKNFNEVGEAIGANENAAKMRVNRALEKLRKIFTKNGVTLSATVIATAVSENSVHAAPIALAKTVTTVALAKGATVSISTLTIIKGALKIMAWTKVKMVVVAGAVVLFAAGTTTVAVKEIQWHKKLYSWEVPKASFEIFYNAQPQITIVPTKFNAIYPNGDFCCDEGRGAMGIAVPLKEMVQIAYQQDYLHTIVVTDLPTNRFDFMAKLVPAQQPHKNIPQNENWSVELQNAIAKKFGIRGQLEMRNTDVFVLKPVNSGVKNFKVSHSMPNGLAFQPIFQPDQNAARVGYSYHKQPISTMTYYLENELKKPIIDQTELNKEYDFSLSWLQSSEKLKEKHRIELPEPDELNPILSDQLGLELISTNMPVEMLVVDKTN